MKRILHKSIFLMLLIATCLLCFSCANDASTEQPQEPTIIEHTIHYMASTGGQIQGKDWQIVTDGQDGEEVTAVPLDGYAFIEWSDGNTSATRKEYNVRNDIDLTARFAEILSVEYTADDNGYIESNNSQSIVYGNDAAAVTAVPNIGYDFLRWSDGVTENPRQDKNITRPLEISAIFTKKFFSVKYQETDGGSVYSYIGQIVYYGESSQSVTATPYPGYEFAGWDDGVKDAVRSDSNITSNITVIAIFKKKNYTVNYVAGIGGHIDGKQTQSVPYHEQAESVTAVADEGYKFVRWENSVVYDNYATSSTRSDTIFKDITFTAIFEKVNYKVNYRTQSGGCILGGIIQNVLCGENSRPVTAVPDPGYEFVGWDDGVKDAVRSDSNITSNITVTAIFKKKNYTVNYIASIGGHIDGKTTQSVPYLEQAESVTAVADKGYKFVRWESDYYTSTIATRSDTIYRDVTYTAIFEKINYNVYYRTQSGGRIVGEEYQIVPHGGNSTPVTAVADDGYEFIGWSDGVTDDTRSESNVTKNITVSAIFDIKPIFAGGAGTLYNPYLIETYEQLLYMTKRPNAAYRLISDLDLSGIDHQPIFDQNLLCQAFLDGDDHTISNLTIDTVHPFPSLLGAVGAYGKIANLNIVDAKMTIHDLDVDSAIQRVGILCGISFGGLENITVSGVIQGEGLVKDYVSIGGLAGQTWYRVTDCHSNVTIALNDIDANNIYAGGLVGIASNSFFNCSSTNSITISSREDSKKEIRNAAGLVCNFTFNEPTDIFVENCHSETDISINVIGYKEGGVCGGLINQISSEASVNISDCSAKGSLSGAFAGGLIKLVNSQDTSITKSFFVGTINVYDTATGFVYDCRPTYEGKTIVEECYSKGSINAGRTGCGFFYNVYTNDVTISKCYSGMDITAYDAHGFGCTFAGTAIQQCFTYGEINARSYASGLLNSIGKTSVSDCYSLCNIKINNPKSQLTVGGLIEMVASSIVKNCYFAGTILCQGNDKSLISALCSNLSPNAVVENCHWLNIQTEGYNEVIAFNKYREETIFIDIYSYDSLEEMKHPNSTESLADILNGDSPNPVWIQVDNELPTLRFATI